MGSPPLLRQEEVDPLGYGLASLGREQPFLFGDVQHGFGHLVQGQLIRVQPPRYVGVACTQLDVAVLQREERHEEIHQVSRHQLTLSKATWGRGAGHDPSHHHSSVLKPGGTTLGLHGLGPQPVLQVFHADVFAILPGVPEVQRDVVDRRSADVTVETTAASGNTPENLLALLFVASTTPFL